MMRAEIEAGVIAILARQLLLSPAEITPDAGIEALGLDSLGKAEAIFALEERFDIAVPFNANEPSESDFDISTVASIVAAVEALVAARPA